MMLFLPLFLTVLVVPVTTTLTAVTTPGLTIVFNGTAAPIALKNAEGDELLLGDGSGGFALNRQAPPNSSSHQRMPAVRFNTIRSLGDNKNFIFGISNSDEKLGVAFGGANHYLTVEITSTEGFEQFDGKSVTFELTGKGPDALLGVSLNYMIYDQGNVGGGGWPNPCLTFEAPWANDSPWNPRGRFAVYERIDDTTEDETLFDLWVDEGVSHPRVDGTWTREAAKAWLQSWIKFNYDSSQLAMVPASHSEFYDFFEFGQLMEAKTLWFNFRAWDYTSIDNVNPEIFPTGVPGFKNFSSAAAKLGFSLSTHRMSGGLDPRDPDYCSPKPDQGLMGFGNMSLVNAVTASDTTIVVKPAPGVKIPVSPKDWKPSMSPDVYRIISTDVNKLGSGSIAGEWITYDPSSIRPVAGGGNWQITVTRTNGANHAAGATVKGYMKGNVYYIPELFSELYEEVAVRYANFSNLIGFDDGSFDGAGWFTYYGHWGFRKFADLVYQNLDHPTSVHTSGMIADPTWFEYRFNAVRTAYGGSFTTQPAGTEFDFGYVGRTTASIEEQSASLLGGLISNSRRFSVGHDLRSVLQTYREIGNVKDVLLMVKDYKAGSLAMGQEQRQRMADAVGHVKKALRGADNSPGVTSRQAGGIRATLNATWMTAGSVFRKWVTTETTIYGSHYFSSNGYIAPRFYTKSGTRSTLVVPAELQSGFTQVKVSGRVLPRYDASSSQNVDLFAAMKVAPGVQLELTASNAQPTEVWDEANLKAYPLTTPLNLSAHQGIGMFVDGDGSGGTLVVRVVCSTVARDFAVPLDFTGKQWIEIPTPEQGWRVKNWGPIGMGSITWFPINYASVTAVALGVGYLPANGHSKVTVSGLQALSNIEEQLVNPMITVGDHAVQTTATLNAFDMFTLDHAGTFTVFDGNWNQLSNCSVAATFNPTNLASFEMGPAAAAGPRPNSVWLEIAVAGSTETTPNPGYTGSPQPL